MLYPQIGGFDQDMHHATNWPRRLVRRSPTLKNDNKINFSLVKNHLTTSEPISPLYDPNYTARNNDLGMFELKRTFGVANEGKKNVIPSNQNFSNIGNIKN